ncbi:transmembrane protein 256 homolog [Glandiceps talaboti]
MAAISARSMGQIFLRIGALSGASAVCLGAYGAHTFKTNVQDPHRQMIFDTANKYHFLHSLVLLAMPLARKPLLAGSLITAGMVLFSGTCYLQSIHEMDSVRKFTPMGGLLLIAGWVALAL